MFRKDQKSAQAATELAVFGAILIFLLGTIVRSGVSNSYTQNQNFKAMRLAMMNSWKDSLAHPGPDKVQITAHNSAQILFVEDRLAPDFSKVGPLERTPVLASGQGSFTYNLLYPLSALDTSDMLSSLPIMDIYLNGLHFPLTMSAWKQDIDIAPPVCRDPNTGFATPGACCNQDPPGSCKQQQCLRNIREWEGGLIQAAYFDTTDVADPTVLDPSCQGAATPTLQTECQIGLNACTIFQGLGKFGILATNSPTCSLGPPSPSASRLNTALITTASANQFNIMQAIATSTQWNQNFVPWFESTAFPQFTLQQDNQYLTAILKILQLHSTMYKLFYTLVPNPGASKVSTTANMGQIPVPQFSTVAPVCLFHPCASNELSSDAPLVNMTSTALTADQWTHQDNRNAVMQYDLKRNADYSSGAPTSVASEFPTPDCTNPPCAPFPPGMRDYIAWQWSATAGTTPAMIGLNTTGNVYPSYDVDGRLKEVTIYNIWQTNGETHVSYLDPDGGDIDSGWDTNSCGPKPGIQQTAQIFTFTKPGTYLEIREGKMYNPETQVVVRSVSKRDTVDVIQRTIQLSNQTGRFCCGASPDPNAPCSGVSSPHVCAPPPLGGDAGCAVPNPVEVCLNSAETPNNNCFTSANIEQTCMDTAQNKIFARSRVTERRGHYWITDTTGTLHIH